jgi:predicted flap endonuclease-1-like 5' DNA nuclease
MTYLLAKFTLLFLAATLLGFALGYWFSRRKFVDVSESYEDLRTANSRSDTMQWEQLWKRLDSMPTPKEPNFTAINERIAGVSAAIASLPQPAPVSFASVENRLDSLQESVGSIPVPVRPKEPDLRPLVERLDNLELAVRNIPKPEPQREVDLKPVQSELTSLRGALKALPVVESHEPADLAPVTSQLKSLEQTVSTIPRPQSVDLAPVDRRLTAIETELTGLGKQLARRTTQERTPRLIKERAPRKTSRKEPRILSAALYGKKDDLKLISGVGPTLEKVLNKNGVYYYWQVAEWSARDINVIDERLDAFKGRIARDKWVHQAKQLRRKPDAASRPAE